MFVVRNVFDCKPGKAKDLVARFKTAAPYLQEMGIRNTRILTDAATEFWTVVVESEVESLDAYYEALRNRPTSGEVQEAMSDYMELVTGGRRQILRLE